MYCNVCVCLSLPIRLANTSIAHGYDQLLTEFHVKSILQFSKIFSELLNFSGIFSRNKKIVKKKKKRRKQHIKNMICKH